MSLIDFLAQNFLSFLICCIKEVVNMDQWAQFSAVQSNFIHRIVIAVRSEFKFLNL